MAAAATSAGPVLGTITPASHTIKAVAPPGKLTTLLELEGPRADSRDSGWVVGERDATSPVRQSRFATEHEAVAKMEALKDAYTKRGYQLEDWTPPQRSGVAPGSPVAESRAAAEHPFRHKAEQHQQRKPQHDAPRAEKRSETAGPDNHRPDKPPSTSPQHESSSSEARVDRQAPPAARDQRQDGGFDWGTFAESAGKSVATAGGIALGAGALVGLGLVSAPFVIGAGVAWGIGSGVSAFFDRSVQAMDQGGDDDDATLRAGIAAVSAMVPGVDVIGVLEVATGFDYVTGEEMTQEERANKAGGLAAGGLAAGAAAGAKAARARLRQSSPQEKFVKEARDEFQAAYEKAKKELGDESKQVIGSRAHQIATRRLRKSYGDDLIEEPITGVTHSGAKGKGDYDAAYGDVAAIGPNAMVEFKPDAKLVNGRLLMLKPVGGGKWDWQRTVQTQSQEIFGSTMPDWSMHVVTAKGQIFTFHPERGKWTQMK